MKVPIDEQCQYHSETVNNKRTDYVIYKCEHKAVAVAPMTGKRMCKMHRRHFDNRAQKLGLQLSVPIKDTTK